MQGTRLECRCRAAVNRARLDADTNPVRTALHKNSVGAVSDRDFGICDRADPEAEQHRRRRRLPVRLQVCLVREVEVLSRQPLSGL
jgi:hypothetical protein